MFLGVQFVSWFVVVGCVVFVFFLHFEVLMVLWFAFVFGAVASVLKTLAFFPLFWLLWGVSFSCIFGFGRFSARAPPHLTLPCLVVCVFLFLFFQLFFACSLFLFVFVGVFLVFFVSVSVWLLLFVLACSCLFYLFVLELFLLFFFCLLLFCSWCLLECFRCCFFFYLFRFCVFGLFVFSVCFENIVYLQL